MALFRRLPPPLGWAFVDAALLTLLWSALHLLRFGALPSPSRGPLVVIPLLIALQWLLGTYTGLARHTLSAQQQVNRYLSAAGLVILSVVFGYAVTGLSLDATIGRGFLLPVLLCGLVSGLLLRLAQGSRHLWQPQQRWLVLAQSNEREVLARELDEGGCAIPAAVEWHPLAGAAPLPTMLPDLLQLQGVAVGRGGPLGSEDAAQLLLWQRQGLALLPLPQWCEQHLRRLPAEFLPGDWAEREHQLGSSRSPQSHRVKRLGDLALGSVLALVLGPPLLVLVALLHLGGIHVQLARSACLGIDATLFRQWRLTCSGRGGRWLESHGLAAIPQLINVLLGEMSLVGPRPITPDVQASLERLEPAFALRLRAKPGMTGWGRISGPPPAESDAMRWELGRDLYYIRCFSIGLDAWILARATVQFPLKILGLVA